MPSPQRGRPRTVSQLSRVRSPNYDSPFHDNPTQDGSQDLEQMSNGSSRRSIETSSPRRSFSGTSNQKTPARSYVHRSFHNSHAPIDIVSSASNGVREDTAELASLALSDVTRNATSPASNANGNGFLTGRSANNSYFNDRTHEDESGHRYSNASTKPEPIEEVSEPTTPYSSSSLHKSNSTSALTKMVRDSSAHAENSSVSEVGTDSVRNSAVLVENGIISQPTERTSLLLRKTYHSNDFRSKHFQKDLERQTVTPSERKDKSLARLASAYKDVKCASQIVLQPKRWNSQKIWRNGVQAPLACFPPVILGLLLNILDALSYGMILFPLSEPIFAGLGPDGISMFYVSCIVSQLVYSCGGSIFRGGVGSEMIEIVPFYHGITQTILTEMGDSDPKAVLATTILSFSISAVLTGLVFFIMGQCKLGSLIGFFPRHILIGCIGGVGLFLVATGFEVSARLEGSFTYTLETIRELSKPEKIPLWAIPLALAILLLTIKTKVKHPLTDATYFISIIAIFYIVEAASSQLTMPKLRDKGWVFEAPTAGVPWYHFYTLYDFSIVDWSALASTIPAMLALTFFGLLHLPINIPSLALTLGEDNVDIDRELRAHGISNALSGLCGSVQNYLVYTNTVLFVRGGGDSRFAGILLAIATAGILIIGPVIIGYIPVMVVGALIFFLGIDLLREALWTTFGKAHRLEYLTIIVIVITMGVWDFVIGILVGIVLACVSFVLQTSQISAIRGQLYGGVANSTVRRHPIQHAFLERAGSQIQIMKLAGFLFFGTIVEVEKQIRALLEDAFHDQPIRFLVLDLHNVDGVDFSAAEAFTRINRILCAREVQMVLCSFTLDEDIGNSLRNAGLFDEEESAQYFQSLNSALEFCENELLKAFYHTRDAIHESAEAPTYLDVPKSNAPSPAAIDKFIFNSPRQSHLHRVATSTLDEQSSRLPAKWNKHEQPLQLILQTFSTVSDKADDFWFPVSTYFERREYPTGSMLYEVGDSSHGFYLLESGILKAEYDLPQGKYSEIIVAGTTCGELPFFSSTSRTATTYAEADCVTWMLTQEKWTDMQNELPAVTQELLKISLKLTSERMNAITKYMLLTSG